MNYIEFTATLKELGFTIPEKHSSQSQWSITSKQLKYVEGIKGCGVDILFYEPPNAYKTARKSICIVA